MRKSARKAPKAFHELVGRLGIRGEPEPPHYAHQDLYRRCVEMLDAVSPFPPLGWLFTPAFTDENTVQILREGFR
jgi:hypothetical protein